MAIHSENRRNLPTERFVKRPILTIGKLLISRIESSTSFVPFLVAEDVNTTRQNLGLTDAANITAVIAAEKSAHGPSWVGLGKARLCTLGFALLFLSAGSRTVEHKISNITPLIWILWAKKLLEKATFLEL